MDFLVKTIRPAPYLETYDAMRKFTTTRATDTPDEIWLCEHLPVYTLGLAGEPEHVLSPHDIPVVHTNRGGQVTYHGPGQVVAYVLMDMRRCNYYIREYVYRIELAAITTLEAYGVSGFLVAGAHGVYVRAQQEQHPTTDEPDEPDVLNELATLDFTGLAKISALGVKVSNHCTYHGIALNVHMDLQPFEWINPCGYAGLKTTDLKSMGIPIDEHSWEQIAKHLSEELARAL